jgi:hypothetical protein
MISPLDALDRSWPLSAHSRFDHYRKDAAKQAPVKSAFLAAIAVNLHKKRRIFAIFSFRLGRS